MEGTTVVKEFVEACRLYCDVLKVRQMIDEGVDINGIHNNFTGLTIALKYNNRPIVNMLLDCPDTDVNIRDSAGRTALYDAMGMANTEAVNKILSRGDVRLDNIDFEHRTVLHFACKENKEEYVKMILAHRKCTKDIVNMTNKWGKTAEEEAGSQGHYGCVRLIMEHESVVRRRRVERMTPARDDVETLSSSQLDAIINDFEAVECTLKLATKARENHMRADITGMENQIKRQKQLLHEFRIKSAADIADIEKKKEEIKSLKRRRGVDPSPQTRLHPVQVPECPVCYEKMTPPKQIFTCGNGHVICSVCKTRVNETRNNTCVSQCGSRYTGRATTVEQIVGEILGTL